jgi:hypothetical protein
MLGKMSTKQDTDFKLLAIGAGVCIGVKQSDRGGGKKKRKWNHQRPKQHKQMKASNGRIELEVNNASYKPDQENGHMEDQRQEVRYLCPLGNLGQNHFC